MRTIPFIILLFFCALGNVYAQEKFTRENLLEAVRAYHPVMRQASLDLRIADAELLRNRAPFDPVISYDQKQKDFDGTNYYDRNLAEFKLPTWYGVDINAGREVINGERINEEETKGTLNFVGVSLDPFQTLLIDKRRAALQEAKIFQQQSRVQQKLVINDLYKDALLAYFEWWQYHEKLNVVQQAVANALQRLMMVRNMYRAGERPAIDTLEAFAQVQSMQQYENEIWTEVLKSRLQLSTYLWNANGNPYDLPEQIVPANLVEELIVLDSLMTSVGTHPELEFLGYDNKALELQKRLAFAELLPDVELKYNQLSRPSSKLFNGNLFRDNNRFGISLALPLRLSEARGNFQTAKWKLMQQQLEIDNRRLLLENKVKQEYLQWQQTRRQVDQQEQMVKSYRALQSGEEMKFVNGESSLFLINSRQLKYLEEQQKLIELRAAAQIALTKVKWAAGILR